MGLSRILYFLNYIFDVAPNQFVSHCGRFSFYSSKLSFSKIVF
ncbi:hypothetical protein LEP1GSC061_4146 [Leptospira wolffii serovar Khorat str. Khorat-H2]|nr:hypothetical protein LEP1GSC061_4146 [Leptospira wolffii serovar Khorat str. Khorat-H2]